MTFLLGVGRSLWGLLTSAADLVMKYAAIWGAYVLGRKAEQKKQLERINEIQRKQLKISNRAKLRRNQLLKRMRERKR